MKERRGNGIFLNRREAIVSSDVSCYDIGMGSHQYRVIGSSCPFRRAVKTHPHAPRTRRNISLQLNLSKKAAIHILLGYR